MHEEGINYEITLTHDVRGTTLVLHIDLHAKPGAYGPRFLLARCEDWIDMADVLRQVAANRLIEEGTSGC
jgi:hypothetical protein